MPKYSLNNILEATIFLVAFSFVIYSMNAGLGNDERYYLFLRATSLYMLIVTLLYVKNLKNKIYYTSIPLIMWHCKDIYFGNPFVTHTAEKIFTAIAILSTIILLIRQWKTK